METFAPLTEELKERLEKAVTEGDQKPPKPKAASKAPFDPSNRRHVARLRSALEHLSVEDAEDFEKWKRVTLALGHEFHAQEGEGIEMALEFARRARNFDEAQTRNLYFVASQQAYENPVGVGSIFDWAKAAGWKPGINTSQSLALLQGDATPEAILDALTTNAAGGVLNTIANCALLLRHALTVQGGSLVFDEFRRAVMARRGDLTAEVTDRDVLDWTARFQMDERSSKVTFDTMHRAVDLVAYQNAVDPVVEELKSLVWDGEPRLATLLPRGFGIVSDDYTMAAGRNFLIAAVARQFAPGCQVDTVLVLEGPQGIKKSTALRTLFGDAWFSDDLPPFDNADFGRFLRGKVCFEIADLSPTKRADVVHVKAVLTRRIDRYRDPYARREIEVPRRCIFAATTNDSEYLKDATGNRRFIPVVCGAIDIAWLSAVRGALFAEAVAAYRAGDEWWQYPEERAVEEQEKRRERHGIEDAVADWSTSKVAELVTHVRTMDLCQHLLGIPVERRSSAVNRMIAQGLRAAGWVKVKNRTSVGAESGWWFHRAAWAVPSEPVPMQKGHVQF